MYMHLHVFNACVMYDHLRIGHETVDPVDISHRQQDVGEHAELAK